jgi:hypothetical protein
MKTYKKYFRELYFEIGWHVGRQQFYIEVVNVGAGKILCYETYPTENQAYNILTKYGYHNVGRFILGE